MMEVLTANTMLAAKISFINENINICERVGADVNKLRQRLAITLFRLCIWWKLFFEGCEGTASNRVQDQEKLYSRAITFAKICWPLGNMLLYLSAFPWYYVSMNPQRSSTYGTDR